MLEVIIAQYGLVAVFIGTFLEGEIVVVAGGFLSRLGFLMLPAVFLTALIATFLGDQFFFYIGRKKGNAFLAKRPHLHKRAEKVQKLIHDHHDKILFFYRFLYGLRIPTLLALGTSELPTRKFVLLNLINSLVWTSLFVFGGFFFGEFFTYLIGNVKEFEKEIILSIAAVAIAVWLASIILNRKEYN
jgi:membrane protein DedA with SNARE-associated domain